MGVHAPIPLRQPCPSLPQEVVDAIVDHCHADKETLQNCSRVCKSWLPATRYHVFSRIRLHPHNVVAFLQLLSSPLCTIAPFVSHLALAQGPSKPIWFNKGIPRLTGFVSLRFLSLMGLGLYHCNISTRLKFAFNHNYDSVTDLEIYHGFFESFSQFASIISSFRNMECLSVEYITCRDRTLPPPVERHPLCRLRTLMFKSRCTSDIFSWLLSHEHLPPISTVYLDYMTWSHDAAHLNHFSRRLGPHLEHLHLKQASIDDLSQNIRLCSINIDLSLTGPTNEWVTSLISTITSPRMKSVVLKTTFFRPSSDLETLDWASLEKTLAQPQFADLKTLEFCHPWTPSDLVMMNTIRGKLPNCEARGLIRISRPAEPPTPFADYLHPFRPTIYSTRPGIFRSFLRILRRWWWNRRILRS